ncbi:MAG: hypothetical protein AAFX81_14735 [Pseudomonadota bacterium]
MSIEPQTWIVGARDEHGLSVRCLLALADRFELPPTVAIDHGERLAQAESAPDRVLAFVAKPPAKAAGSLDLLRDGEAMAVLGHSPAPPVREGLRDGSVRAAAVAVCPSRAEPVDDAVKLAVTTLIDWGHDVTARDR